MTNTPHDQVKRSLATETKAVTRRDALRLAGGLGLAAAGSGLAFASMAKAATPRKGGVARIATEISDANATLDPIRLFTNTDIARGFQLYNGLVKMDENLTVQPSLAESWEPANKDGTEWVFKLRRSATFHNGKSLGAADVVWNMNRHLGPKSESRARNLVADVEDVRADDDMTVRFMLSSPNVEFPALLTLPGLAIVPEGHEDFSNPVGTGPFKMKEFTPGGSSSFVRNENYWNADKVYLDEIELVAISDPANRLNGVLSGDLHFAMTADVTAVPLLDKSDVAEKLYARAGQCVGIVMQCDREPTSSGDLRMAMKLLQDRQFVLENVYKGFAQIANDQPVSPTDPMYASDIPIRPYDVDRAKFHLKKAGSENLSIEIYVAPGAGPGVIEQALTFQQKAAPAGVTVNVKQVPGEGYWSTTWRKHPFTGWHINMRARSDHLWSYVLKTDSVLNTTNFRDPRIDDLLKAARSEFDEQKRKRYWHDLQLIVHEEAGYLMPVFPDYLHSKSRTLKGVRAHPTGGTSDFLSGEGWWLDA
ncbi:MAG: ABC transporter substrate-binding protein [Kiloniellales bacterium]|nr:ABC transporter substrate-binding protein [Kiloniellales bacterium]